MSTHGELLNNGIIFIKKLIPARPISLKISFEAYLSSAKFCTSEENQVIVRFLFFK